MSKFFRIKHRKAALEYAIASLTLGIGSVLLICCCCFSFLYWVGVVGGILSVVFACVSRSANGGKMMGMAVAGLILGIIALLLFLFYVALEISVRFAFADPDIARAYLEQLEQYYRDMGFDVDFSDAYARLE